jgi:hypothetical protein
MGVCKALLQSFKKITGKDLASKEQNVKVSDTTKAYSRITAKYKKVKGGKS